MFLAGKSPDIRSYSVVANPSFLHYCVRICHCCSHFVTCPFCQPISNLKKRGLGSAVCSFPQTCQQTCAALPTEVCMKWIPSWLSSKLEARHPFPPVQTSHACSKLHARGFLLGQMLWKWKLSCLGSTSISTHTTAHAIPPTQPTQPNPTQLTQFTQPAAHPTLPT